MGGPRARDYGITYNSNIYYIYILLYNIIYYIVYNISKYRYLYYIYIIYSNTDTVILGMQCNIVTDERLMSTDHLYSTFYQPY